MTIGSESFTAVNVNPTIGLRYHVEIYTKGYLTSLYIETMFRVLSLSLNCNYCTGQCCGCVVL